MTKIIKLDNGKITIVIGFISEIIDPDVGEERRGMDSREYRQFRCGMRVVMSNGNKYEITVDELDKITRLLRD